MNNSVGPKSPRGFTLVEMLAVLAIIIILLSLLAPLINSFSSTAGRKGAINVIMNTFEQARAVALSTGTNVYVVLRKRQFPDQDSIMVARDAVEWNPDEKGKNLILLTRWIALPKGILLYTPKGANIFKAGISGAFDVSALPTTGGKPNNPSSLACVKFGPTGAVLHPTKNDCKLLVGEGVRGSDGNETLITANKDSGLFDVITLRRFTGRATLDVSTVAGL